MENLKNPHGEMPEDTQEYLKADPSGLSLDDLDSVAGGRGRRKYQPRRHIGPDARREEEGE